MGRFLLFGIILAVAVTIAFHLVRGRSASVRPPSLVAPPDTALPPKAPTEVMDAQRQESDAGLVTEDPLSDILCLPGMSFVAGPRCAAISRTCLKEEKNRCIEFSSAVECVGGGQQLHFCIDRYEFPNLAGVMPAVMVHFDEARHSCEAEGKRLCRDAEWTLACEGMERRPFPYGFRHQPGVCNLGQSGDPVDWQAFTASDRVAAEMAGIDARSASGSRPGCVSSTGSYDLLGNAQEWVISEQPGYQAALRGGDFHQEYATCRQSTNVEHRLLRLPYNGFRCCADPLVAVPH